MLATLSHGDVSGGLLCRVMSGSMTLQQLGLESISVPPFLIEGLVVAWGLIRHLGPSWCPRAMVHPGPYRSKQNLTLPTAKTTPGPGLQLGAVSESMALLQPGFVLMTRAPVGI